MAVWQFDLDFEHAEDGRTLSAASTERLMGLLSQSVGPSQTMMREWRYFGDRYGNRVDVVMEPDGSSQVQARLDARADETDGFIRKVCAGAAATGCVLVCEELGITLKYPDYISGLRACLEAEDEGHVSELLPTA